MFKLTNGTNGLEALPKICAVPNVHISNQYERGVRPLKPIAMIDECKVIFTLSLLTV